MRDVFMEDETGIEKLRRIVTWADWQDEYYFDGLSIEEIIRLFELVTVKAGVDMITDVDENDFAFDEIRKILKRGERREKLKEKRLKKEQGLKC